MKTKFFEAQAHIHNKDSNFSTCEGERCRLDKIIIVDNQPFAELTNTVEHKVLIPYDVFREFFEPSQNQISPL